MWCHWFIHKFDDNILCHPRHIDVLVVFTLMKICADERVLPYQHSIYISHRTAKKSKPYTCILLIVNAEDSDECFRPTVTQYGYYPNMTRISEYICYKVRHGTTYPLPNFNGTAAKVWEWISNLHRNLLNLLGTWLLIHAGLTLVSKRSLWDIWYDSCFMFVCHNASLYVHDYSYLWSRESVIISAI